ncbi:hypothetical protein UlMin_031670 [Ulmus minor]
MGKEHVATELGNGNAENLSAPPGFLSPTAFKLKRVRVDEETDNSEPHCDAPKQNPARMGSESGITDADMVKRSLKHKPWMLFDLVNHNLEETEIEHSDKDVPSEVCLPKGVIRGCSDCTNCLKVTARWRPMEARVDALKEAPVFYPTEEEFIDTLEYIEKISPTAEPYGICRIVPPPSWNPPSLLKKKGVWESSRFSTYTQWINGLQVPYTQSKAASFIKNTKSKRRRTSKLDSDSGHVNGHATNVSENGHCDVEGLESENGPEFTMETFKKYADDFRCQYFCKSIVTKSNDCSTMVQEEWEPSVKNIEGEYKRIIENPTEEIEVLCAENLETGFLNLSSPAEISSDPKFGNWGWNLSNLPKLPGSLLSFKSCDTSHVLVPRVRIGMCFSSFHWRVEDHHLYSLCYLHMGAPKVWYAIPEKHRVKFQTTLKNSMGDCFEKHDQSHHRLVKQLSPSTLNSEDFPVFRCVQNPREFVLVFPGAYHSGFDCGFNCSEAANFAPLDWLPHGQNAVDHYRELGKKTSISYDKLLLGAAMEAVRAQWDITLCGNLAPDNLRWKKACGKEGILARTFKSRVKHEELARKYLCNSSQTRKMDKDFDATTKRECKICHYDLHFSAAACPCSEDQYSCLDHAKQLCRCTWTDKFFLVRHKISDLNLLAEALEGKLSSVYKFAKENLGLGLNSVSRNSSQASKQAYDPTSPPVKPAQKDHKSQDEATPKSARVSSSSIREELKAKMLSKRANKLKATATATAAAKAKAKASTTGEISCSSTKPNEKEHVDKPTRKNEQKAKENTVSSEIMERVTRKIYEVSSDSDTSESSFEY